MIKLTKYFIAQVGSLDVGKSNSAHNFNNGCYGGLAEVFRWFPFWLISQNSRRRVVLSNRPWLSYPAVRYLIRLSPQWVHNAKVFEFGTGSSTIFFLEHALAVVSVEHDASWYRMVSEEISRRGWKHWTGVLRVPHDISDNQSTTAALSSRPAWRGKDFRRYVEAIDQYPDEHFDLVMVDGRSRLACLDRAWAKLRHGGLLILDNVERTEYWNVITRSRSDVKMVVVGGPTPGVKDFTKTAFLFRP